MLHRLSRLTLTARQPALYAQHHAGVVSAVPGVWMQPCTHFSVASNAAAKDAAAASAAEAAAKAQAQAEVHAPIGATTHFGYREVPTADKAQMVGSVFHKVADKYDLMNDVMSGGLHRLWKDAFVERIGPIVAEGAHAHVLDVAGGTGDIAFRIAQSARRSLVKKAPTLVQITVCDINPSMLQVGKQRAIDQGFGAGTHPVMHWIEGNAEQLPFADNSMDLYTIAFGIRNVTNVQKALNDAFRVLKPGGRFMCLEFSQVPYPVLKEVYDWYSFNIIPEMGKMVAGDRDSYQYLVESIRQFPNQERFADMIKLAGFQNVSYENFSAGAVALHSGFKW